MLRGSVVGFGRMGITHFSILNNHPEVQFVAVCDSWRSMLKNVKRYIGVETFNDYHKMIDKMDLDFVIVATPSSTHIEIVKYAIQNNLHVFVEKPFSLNPKQGREAVDMLQAKNLVNQVSYVNRFNDIVIQIKKLLDSGAIGELLTFQMEMSGPTILNRTNTGWRSRKTEGGGCLYDFASHSIDLINYLIGIPDVITGSVMQSIHSTNVDDVVCSTFLYKRKLHGNLLVNWSDPSERKPTYRMKIFGREGKIIANLHAYKVYFSNEPGIKNFTQGWNQCYITDFVEPVRYYVRGFEFTRQLDYFIDCILNKIPSQICSFEDGLKTDIIIERIARDATQRSI